jgi:hypothetical protein
MENEGEDTAVATATILEAEVEVSKGDASVSLNDVTLSVMNNNDKRDEDFDEASSVRHPSPYSFSDIADEAVG